ELAETLRQPEAPCRFSERRRGHPRRLHLPLRKLRFLGPEAVECDAHFRQAGEPRHFFQHRGMRIRECLLGNGLHALRLSYNVRVASPTGCRASLGLDSRGRLSLRKPWAAVPTQTLGGCPHTGSVPHVLRFDRLSSIPDPPLFPSNPVVGGTAVKTVLKVAGIVVAVLIVAAIAIPFLVNVNSFRPQIESNLSSALGRPVKVGNLSLSILSGSVEADQLSIADDPKFGSAPFIQAKSLQVGVELMPFIFSKQLNVTRLLIDRPEIALLRNREGVWNFSSLGNQSAQQAKAAETSSAPANVNVAKLDLTDG